MSFRLSEAQLRALSAAYAAAHKRGLERITAGKGRWFVDDAGGESHDHRTIASLVATGDLQLYASGTCAHITDGGRLTLEYALEALGQKL